jgi:hypothetical protein
VEGLSDLPRHSALLTASIDRLRGAGAFRGAEDAWSLINPAKAATVNVKRRNARMSVVP